MSVRFEAVVKAKLEERRRLGIAGSLLTTDLAHAPQPAPEPTWEPTLEPAWEPAWGTVAKADPRLRLRELLLVEAITILAVDGELAVPRRSLMEALKRSDGFGYRAAIDNGIARLIDLNYLTRLNPGAPRRERARYRLSTPTAALAA